MLVDMLFWAFDNPPPGNFLLISGDRDLSDLLHRLRMKRYDILLMRPSNASSQVLAGAAKKVWLWESLATGEVVLPESPPANSVLGCKLYVNNSSSVLGCKLNVNNSDTLKCSQSKAGSEYGKGDGNLKAGNQCRVEPLQIYVKKTSCASSPAGNPDGVESIGGVSESSTGSTASDLDQSSLSSSSSSSDSLEKVNTSVPLETLALSKPSAQKPVLSTQSQQVEATRKSILGEKPSTSAECVARNGTLDFGGSKRHCNQTYQQIRYSEAQNGLHSEFKAGDNNGKAANRHRVKPLQKYVKKTNITFSSASNQVDSVGVPECPIGSTTSELDQSSVSSSSSSETLEVAKADNSGQPETSTWSHSSAPKSVPSAHLHQVRASHEFAKKPGISVEHASRNGTQYFDVSTVSHHPAYQQSQYSEAQNKLHSNSNVGDNSGKFGNKHKVKQHQVYVKKIVISSASASNEIGPINGFLDNPKGSTLSHPSQYMSASSNSKSLQSAKVNQSCPLRNPPFSVSSAHKSIVSDDLHQEGAGLIFGKKDSTSVQCTDQNGTFVFGVSSGHFHPTYQQSPSPLLLEQHNSGIPHIRYGEMNLRSFDVKKALELAIRHEAVVMKKLVKDMPLFVAKDESLWKCVNVTNSKAKDPKEELDAVHKYISSTDGHSAIKNSQSRYQAATILKKSCLQLAYRDC